MDWQNGREDGLQDASSTPATYSGPLNDFLGMIGNREAVEANLVRHYDSLIKNYARSREELQMAQATASLWQKTYNEMEKKLAAAETELVEIKTANSSKSFTYVLLDGDGAIFRDEFIRKGAEGGEEAAHLLKNRVQQYVKEIDATVNTDYVVAQIVLNLDGLQRALHASDTIKHPDLVSFARGFCRVQPLFSIVDVGSGKEQTDAKVKRMFELMIANHQCKHMIWGPTHDNGYVRMLKEVAGNPAVYAKLTLLEATPPAAEFMELTYRTTRFPDVFRSEMIPSRSVHSLASAPMLPTHTTSYPASSISASASRPSPSMKHGVPSSAVAKQAPAVTPPPAAATPSSAAKPPAAAKPVPAALVTVSQSPRSLSAKVDANSASWAAVGRNSSTGGGGIEIAPRKKTQVSRKYMLLNKDNRRIDEPIKHDPNVMKWFKEDSKYNGNHCNKYHLRNMCTEGEQCNFRHEPLKKDEIQCLRILTRQIACRESYREPYCADVLCTLGHHCTRPNACNFGSCKFAFLHDVNFDMIPTMKIYEDGEREVLL